MGSHFQRPRGSEVRNLLQFSWTRAPYAPNKATQPACVLCVFIVAREITTQTGSPVSRSVLRAGNITPEVAIHFVSVALV